ncbi:hypothetical protein B0F90DRAFT_1822026 [Multifurca ochricompacta]|uniref:MYND-type domain-containing protein n=1 Tax=Multifurca ochricompacta TaxID=376703 RepID=A0AAD4QK38_9AGAM|nr:hypothetical protein B0F90DRAFT_1822026 [Multifurca ochricompacta]
MRESNFAFPAQNRAAVCISSQLYDRRALDTNSPLPLFNSLTHLTYLTSTSPRIREIMVMDGGLERLVRMLHDFCLSPPPPENPLFSTAFDKHAAYRFSLAFQCVVNIGVRGSELIRSRVVQAGTLDVVGCILESWLASKGFAIGPSSSATGMPRETREQRAARKQAQAEMRARQQAADLARALERRQDMPHDGTQTIRGRSRVSELTIRVAAAAATTTTTEEDDRMDTSADSAALSDDSSATQADISGIDSPTPASDAASAAAGSDPDTSTDTSRHQTPAGSNTPTGAVEVPGRDRSGTIIARPIWDTSTALLPRRTHRTRDRQGTISASTSRGASRPETETEDDADGDLDMDPSQEVTDNSPERPQTSPLARRAVAIVSDVTTDAGPGQSLELNSDAHIIINSEADVQGDGVEDGIVALEPNDDFAMGAPPGAPGAIETTMTLRPADTAVRRVLGGTDVTPRAVNVSLPRGRDSDDPQETPVRPNAPIPRTLPLPVTTEIVPAPPRHHHHHHHHESGCPHRDEEVLSALQLLAYLSKYPHVRQAFYQPRTSFHPATAVLKPQAITPQSQQTTPAAGPSRGKDTSTTSAGFFKAFASRNGKEKAVPAAPAPPTPPRQTNVFSLVERFTFRPSSHEFDLPNPPPTLPPEIQYWAGVIMRNACRKDDSRGGIRQCANMLCGRWEQYPRQFAKCRRCRKAKYCGKECQSSAWSEGHRFWCSAKDGDEDGENVPEGSRGGANGGSGGGSVRRRERLMATTEITDAAIRATAAAMAFRPIEGARPPEGPGWGRAFYEPSPFDAAPGPVRRPVVHVGQEAAATMGIGPGIGRRRAETMPGGMMPVIDPPAPAPPPPSPSPSPPTASSVTPIRPTLTSTSGSVHVSDHGRLIMDQWNDGSSPTAATAMMGGSVGLRIDLSTIAGPSRVVRNDDGAVFGFATGEEIAMDLD